MVELIMKVVLALGVVLVIVGAASWLVKRAGLGGTARKRSFLGPEVIATTHLAPRQALHLVRVGEEVVLVGATREQISALGRFVCPADHRPEAAPHENAASARSAPGPGAFLDYVEAALRGGQIHPERTHGGRIRAHGTEPDVIEAPLVRK